MWPRSCHNICFFCKTDHNCVSSIKSSTSKHHCLARNSPKVWETVRDEFWTLFNRSRCKWKLRMWTLKVRRWGGLDPPTAVTPRHLRERPSNRPAPTNSTGTLKIGSLHDVGGKSCGLGHGLLGLLGLLVAGIQPGHAALRCLTDVLSGKKKGRSPRRKMGG